MPPRRRATPADSANQQGQGNVYGPRSALTSFLREQGITGAGSIPGRRPRSPSTNPSTPSTSATPGDGTTPVDLTAASSSDADDPSASASTSATATASSSRAASTPATDGNAEAGPSSGATTTKRKAKPLTAAAAKKAKKAEAEEFKVGGKAMPQPKKGRYEDRTPGAIKVCGECGKKFTVSKYTALSPSGKLLCGPCDSESIEDRATFPGANGGGKGGAKRPAAPKRKRSEKVQEETKWTEVKTLGQSCLSIIASLISTVEQGAFSYLGPKNLDRVAKIVCKNRMLDVENIKLFLEVGHRELRLYDCTNISDVSLSSISTFCPHLVSLSLKLCGRLDDDVLDAWSGHSRPSASSSHEASPVLTSPHFGGGKEKVEAVGGLKELQHLELYAPYLVTAKKWGQFFERRGEQGLEGLQSFRLRMSARFDETSLHSLLAHNPSLHTLQLSELGRLSGASLPLLYPLGKNGHLRKLDISRMGTPQGEVLEDGDVVGLLKEVGEGLEELVLDGNVLLTSQILTAGVAKYCRNLTALSLSNLHLIDAEGFEELFSGKKVPRAAESVDGGDDEVMIVDPATTTITDAEDGATAPVKEKAKTPEPETDDATPLPPWSPLGLTLLNAHRLTHALTPSSFAALLSHSSLSLTHLNLHSADSLLAPDLSALADKAEKLEVLDVSFVRSVDNFVVKSLLEGRSGRALRTLFVHGNNRVTGEVPRKAGVQIRGLENAVHSEIPSGMRWDY